MKFLDNAYHVVVLAPLLVHGDGEVWFVDEQVQPNIKTIAIFSKGDADRRKNVIERGKCDWMPRRLQSSLTFRRP